MSITYTSQDFVAITKLLLKPKRINGSTTFCHCPYHKDRTPSLSVDVNTGRYKCFSCYRTGHLVKLIPEKFGDKSIAKWLNIDTNDTDFTAFFSNERNKPPTYVEEVSDEEKIDNLNIKITGAQIPWRESQQAIDYAAKRSLPPYILDSQDTFFIEEGYTLTTGDHIEKPKPLYIHKRLCTPVYTEFGKLICIECRDVTQKSPVKILYPRDSIKPLFDWYNLVLSEDVFLFEGLLKMNVARGDRYFTNSIACLGGGISDYQFTLLNKIPYLTVVPDNDEAGERMIKNIKERYTGMLSILRLNTSTIKDCDEIPTKLGVSVRKFREGGGFVLENGIFTNS
jgi:DNA primase